MSLTPARSPVAIARRILRAVFLRTRLDRELDEEMRFHLQLSTEAHAARGLSAGEAARAARLEFGNPGQVADASRDIKRATFIEQLAFDLRSGWRLARRAPWVTLTAIAMLGLGIGSTTTMFSITHGILRDLPVDQPERLVHLAAVNRRLGTPESRISAWEFASIRNVSRALEGVGGVLVGNFHLGEPDRFAKRWSGAAVTPNVFRLLRIRPMLGRDFAEGDAVPGAPAVVILGSTVWRQHFESDSGVLGRSIRVNGELRTVVGVMRDGLRFPREEDLWVPQSPDANAPANGTPAWIAFGRLRSGVTMEAARAELTALDARLGAEPSVRDPDRHLLLRSYREQQISRKVIPIFAAMMLVVSFVLFIACANVAALLLSQGGARTQEMAVRSALGATARRLTVQLVSEVLVLAVGGGVVGLALAAAGVEIFNAVAGFELSYWMSVRVDATVLLCATALVFGAALLAGLVPARLAARVDPGLALKSASRGSSGYRVGRLSRVLVGFQVALSATLLVVTALMIDGVRMNASALKDVQADELHVTRIELRPDAYPAFAEQRRFFSALEAALDGQPGVRSVSLSSALPGVDGSHQQFQIEGRSDTDEASRAMTTSANPGFFRTFGASILEGRQFVGSDDERAPLVAVVNRRFVRNHFAGESPVGRRIRLTPSDSMSTWRTIVGVVNDLEARPPLAPDPGMVYLPLAQTGEADVSITVRASGNALALAPLTMGAVRALHPEVTVILAERLDALLARESSTERLFGGLFLFFGLAALLLASVGLAGLVTLSVQQRRREVGIRLALGARTPEVARLVLRGGVQQLLIGLTVGLTLAVFVARLFGASLMGADASNWHAYAIAGVTLLMTGVLAAWVPARRALRIAPAEVLRSE